MMTAQQTLHLPEDGRRCCFGAPAFRCNSGAVAHCRHRHHLLVAHHAPCRNLWRLVLCNVCVADTAASLSALSGLQELFKRTLKEADRATVITQPAPELREPLPWQQ